MCLSACLDRGVNVLEDAIRYRWQAVQPTAQVCRYYRVCLDVHQGK